MTDSRSKAEAALAKAVAAKGDDHAWEDDLPEIDDLPDDPDATQAVMFPVKPPPVKKSGA
jgi:hypothetical protein